MSEVAFAVSVLALSRDPGTQYVQAFAVGPGGREQIGYVPQTSTVALAAAARAAVAGGATAFELLVCTTDGATETLRFDLP